MKDTSKDLVICESPLKALAVSQAGYAAIGISGVWGFSKKRATRKATLPDGRVVNQPIGPRELIEDFDRIAFAGRRVFILFDSDIHLKEKNVRKAAERLQQLLIARGADVVIVTLPGSYSKPDSNKKLGVGVDDYLVQFGPVALRILIDRAPAEIDTRRAALAQEPECNRLLPRRGYR